MKPPEIDGMEFREELGRGGFAAVYRYRQKLPERDVAVKVFFDVEQRAQVVNEANAMAALDSHPNIARINEVRHTRDGDVCLVMEYFAKDNYAARVANHPLTVREAVDVGIAMANAISFGHGKGILHCDIKPANILVSDADSPMLSDFGIARKARQDNATALAYSPPWAAPEVIEKGEFSPLSDVFALAATIWHLLVGHSPFQVRGEKYDPEVVSRRVLAGPPRPTGRPDVPAVLEALLARSMDGSPSKRPQSATEFSGLLAAIKVGPAPAPHTYVPRGPVVPAPPTAAPLKSPVTAPRPNPVPAQPSTFAPASYSVPPQQHRPSNVERTAHRPVAPVPEPEPQAPPPVRRLPALLLVGAGAAAALVVGLVLVTSGGEEQPSPSSATQDVRDTGEADIALPPGKPTITATRQGTKVSFTWTYSAAAATDTFAWRTNDPAQAGVVDEPALILDASGEVCLEVKVQRVDGSNAIVDWSEKGCA